MRILMVTSEFPPICGGIGWYVYYLSQELESRGHSVTVVQRSPKGIKEFGSWKIHSLDAGIAPLFNAFRMVKKLRNFLAQRPQDIAIVHGTTVGTWLSEIPTILLSHALLAEAKKNIYKGGRDLKTLLHVIFGKLYLETEKRSVYGSSAVSVVSYAMQKEVKFHYNIDAIYVGNAVNMKIFGFSDHSESEGVLLPSFLRPQKGILEAIKVMQIVRKKGCMIPFRFINGGPMKDVLIDAVERFSLYPVELVEPVDHAKISDLYRSNSIVLLTSYYEGLPNVCLEAFSSGLPIVATEAGGTGEVVIHGETGFIHKFTDIEGIADSIIKLDRDPAMRKKFGANGRKLVSENFTWDKVGMRFENLIAEVA